MNKYTYWRECIRLTNIPGAKIREVPDSDVVFISCLAGRNSIDYHGPMRKREDHLLGRWGMNTLAHSFPSPGTNQQPIKSSGAHSNYGRGIGQRGDYEWHNALGRAWSLWSFWTGFETSLPTPVTPTVIRRSMKPPKTIYKQNDLCVQEPLLSQQLRRLYIVTARMVK